LPELIHHGENGLLVPPARVSELAGAMDQMLSDRPAAELLAAAGHASARANYHTPRVMPRILKGYEDGSDYFYQVRAARGVDTAEQWRRAIEAAQNCADEQSPSPRRRVA
jgi:hypothetical protein